MLMDITPFLERRRRLIERMRAAGGGVAVIPTAPERMRNRDTPYPYRPDSYFYYLTGFGEPEAALVLIADETPQALLFCREKNAEKEIWDGFRFGPAGARERFGFDAAYPIDSFDAKLAELIIDQPALWYALGHDAAWDARITAALNGARAQSRAGDRSQLFHPIDFQGSIHRARPLQTLQSSFIANNPFPGRALSGGMIQAPARGR